MVPPERHTPKGSGEVVLLWGLAAWFAILVVLPLGRLLIEGLRPGEHGELLGILRETLAGRSVGRAFWATLWASLGATLVSLAIGGGLAVALRLTDVAGRTGLIFLSMLPMLIPSQISALAWIQLTGPASPVLAPLGLAPPPGTTNPIYSLWGIAWVMGVEHAPLVLLSAAAAMSSVSADLVEAARVAGARPLRIVRAVILPSIGPALAAGSALAFVTSIGDFGVPALLGIPGRVTLLTTLIYQRLTGFGPSVLGEVAAITFILIALAVAGLGVRALFERAGFALERTGPPARPFALKAWRGPVTALCWLVILIVAVLPLVALVASALVPAVGVALGPDTASLDNFEFVLNQSAAIHRAFVNSFLLAATTAIVCALIAVPLGYLSALRKRPLARLLDVLADAPYAVPGTVVAIGVIIVFLPPLPIIRVSLYGTFGILLVAYLARFLLLALRPVTAAFATLDPSLDEAAGIVGAGTMRRLFAIMGPIALPAAIAGGMLIFMTALNELTLSALLWSTGTETLGVMVFFLQYEGNSPAAAALASVVVVMVLALAALFDWLGRRFAPGVVPWQV